MKKLILLPLLLGIFPAFGQDFYDRSTVQTIEIFFASSNWDQELDNLASTTEDYLLADSVRINGIVYDSVGVKYKGNSSYNANNNKNPLHIELDYVHGSYDYQGYTDIKLQNGYQDPSMIREVLSYSILEQYMDCPKSNFANVYINGQLRGLYSSAESINKKFNGDHYYTSNGDFVKCNPLGGAGPGGSGNPDLNYLGADSSLYSGRYELKSDYGWNDLVDMINTLNNDFTQIETKLDMDRALWMLAFNNVLVNLDSYNGAFRQNYYLYRDLNTRFVPTVWDLNMSFGGFPGGTGSGTTDPVTLDPYSNSTSANHPLIKKVLADPMYARMYMAHVRTIVQEIFESGWYVTAADSLRNTIDASVQADPYKFYTYTQYQNSMTTAVSGGGGPGGGTSTPGIQAMMDSRVSFFNSNSYYNLSAPTITSWDPGTSNPVYGQTISLTATVSGEQTVYLGYRTDHTLRFNRIQMYDDGAHNDGAAGDHVYGVAVTLSGTIFEYYIYAENSDAGIFSPQRAEHEFYSLSIPFPTPLAGDVVINEIMAKNGSTAYDSNGESDDWIELFNTTASAIDLSAVYLSDDPANPTMWQFPFGTAINAHGTLIVWCDNDPEQSGLHTNFKLSSNGENLVLTDGTANFLDQVVFGIQTEDVSYLRCPDAGAFTFGAPTFNALNNCFLGLDEQTDVLGVRVYPNPGNSLIFLESDVPANFTICDMQGRILDSGTIEEHSLTYNVSGYQAGFYLIRFDGFNGGVKQINFVKE